jgi:hypothetical protein
LEDGAVTDDPFQAWLGEIGQDDAFLHRVMKGARRAGFASRGSRQLFLGERARGAGVGRVLASRQQSGPGPYRRASAKLYRVLLKGNGYEAVRRHCRYLTNEGKGRDGGPAPLYSREADHADPMELVHASQTDRHQFRMVVAADDAPEYEDLRPYIRRLMNQVTRDLRVDLEWAAADHFDTGSLHTHVVIRGRDRTGSDIVIAPEYIRHGLPHRASELVSLDLGPPDELEREQNRSRIPHHEGPTDIDVDLLASRGDDGLISSLHPNAWQQSARTQRLQFLGKIGLAFREQNGRWRLDPHLQQRLEHIESLNQTVQQVDLEVRRHGIVASPADYSVAGGRSDQGDIVGRIITFEPSDPMALIIDGTDGRVHHRLVDPSPEVRPGSIVRVRAGQGTHTTELTAAGPDGSPTDRLKVDGSGLEMRADLIEPVGISADAAPASRGHGLPRTADHISDLEILSSRPLEDLVGWGGSTWLDRELVAERPMALGKGFGASVRAALEQRRSWLIAEGLAEDRADGTHYGSDLLAFLEARERAQFAGAFERSSGLRFVDSGITNAKREDGAILRTPPIALALTHKCPTGVLRFGRLR